MRGGGREHARVLHSVPDRLIFQGRCQHYHHHHHHQVLAIHNLSHALPIPMSLLKQRRTCTRKASYSSLANNVSHTATFREPSFPPIAREKCTGHFHSSVPVPTTQCRREIMTIQDFHGMARRLVELTIPRDKFAAMKFPRCLYDPFFSLAPSFVTIRRVSEPIRLQKWGKILEFMDQLCYY